MLADGILASLMRSPVSGIYKLTICKGRILIAAILEAFQNWPIGNAATRSIAMPAVPRTEKPIFRINLHPPRSLSRRAARNIVIVLACVTSLIGLVFWAVGAWPVIGFLGVDVILLSLAFYFSFRSARAEERIELRRGNLRVTRISARGARQEFDFQPYWLQVVLERGEDDQCELYLRSHGKRFEIGGFLGAEAKTDLAEKLEKFLRQVRCQPASQTG